MILNELEVSERLTSPDNLINRLKEITKPASRADIQSLPPRAGDVVRDLDKKLEFSSTKAKALGIINKSLDELDLRISEVRPERLSDIVANMSKFVFAEEDRNKEQTTIGQLVVYAPQLVTEKHFNVVEVED